MSVSVQFDLSAADNRNGSVPDYTTETVFWQMIAGGNTGTHIHEQGSGCRAAAAPPA